MFTNKHGKNLLDDVLHDDDLNYATEVGAGEIPGADSDLSEMSDVPDEELLGPDVEIQQSPDETEENVEIETIQEEDKWQVSINEDMQSPEIAEENRP